MNKILKTAFDIDGVLCKTGLLFETLFYERHGIRYDEKVMTTYRFEDAGLPLTIVHDVITAALSPENAHRIEPDRVALDYVTSIYLRTGAYIPIITSRKDETQVRFFLDNYLVEDRFPYVLRCRDRKIDRSCNLKPIQMQELGCVMLVDDSPEVAEALTEYSLTTLLVDRDYNRGCKYGLRVTNWRSVYDLVLLLEATVGACELCGGSNKEWKWKENKG